MYVRNGIRFNVSSSVTIDGVTYANCHDPEIRAQLGITWVDEPEPPTDYSDELYIRVEQDDYPYVVYEPRPVEQINQFKFQRAKVERTILVNQITVTTSTNRVFDGDEKAQDRMARAIASLDPYESTTWVLADNTVATVTREELREALRLAGQAQTEIWVTPYTG